MNCDGFKLDYSLIMPYGKSAKSAGGKYGAQMTKELYNLIYSTAKEIKPDALINASPCLILTRFAIRRVSTTIRGICATKRRRWV